MSLRKSALTGVSAIALSLGLAYSAQADVLPVTNLQFNQFNAGSSFPAFEPKDLFNDVMPTNWAAGTAGANGSLTFVGQQGSEGLTGPRSGGDVYAVYTNPGFTNLFPSPQNVNFFQADGNPNFENTIFQTISGLTAGTTYTLEFLQAAGQQTGFSGATTEQWLVFLGTGGILVNCSANPCVPVVPAGNLFEPSPLMNTGSMMNTDWNTVNLSFTPTAAELTAGTAVLTFLAWGDNGSTTNLPPTVFLEGVNTVVSTPEPATLSLMGVGLLGLGAFSLRRRRAKAKGTAAV